MVINLGIKERSLFASEGCWGELGCAEGPCPQDSSHRPGVSEDTQEEQGHAKPTFHLRSNQDSVWEPGGKSRNTVLGSASGQSLDNHLTQGGLSQVERFPLYKAQSLHHGNNKLFNCLGKQSQSKSLLYNSTLK